MNIYDYWRQRPVRLERRCRKTLPRAAGIGWDQSTTDADVFHWYARVADHAARRPPFAGLQPSTRSRLGRMRGFTILDEVKVQADKHSTNKRMHEKLEQARMKIDAAAKAGKLVGLEESVWAEKDQLKKWMRGKRLRSCIVDVGGKVFAPPWLLMIWRTRHEFVVQWAARDGFDTTSPVKGAAWNALRRLVARATRDTDLAHYLENVHRLNGARGLVGPAREAVAKDREDGLSQEEL